ncbi:hypothetical protein VTN02DRAFT_2325 [Thermoascus thermophilus]
MCRDGFHLLRAVMVRLEGVPFRVDRGVGVVDDHVVRGDLVHVLHDGGRGLRGMLQRLIPWALPQPGALHLVEDGVVAPVDRIPPVDIGHHRVSLLFWARLFVLTHALEIGLLVRTRMRPQDGILVDVVGVGAAPTRVVWREPENVEVVTGRDDGVLLGIVAVDWAGELAFDELSRDRERVVLIEV